MEYTQVSPETEETKTANKQKNITDPPAQHRPQYSVVSKKVPSALFSEERKHKDLEPPTPIPTTGC